MTRDDLFKVPTLCQLFISPLCSCRKLRLASLHAFLSTILHVKGQYVRVAVGHADQCKHCEGPCSSSCRACAWSKSLLPLECSSQQLVPVEVLLKTATGLGCHLHPYHMSSCGTVLG